MKIKIIIFGLFFSSLLAFSQQDAQYTQYMYNTININPAYAGSRDVLSVFALHRTQWVGLKGAPVTNAFSINSPIENSRLGVGLSFVNDRLGPTVENLISADISYTVPTSEDFDLSFGVKGSANLFNFDPSKLNPAFAADPSLQNLSTNFTPNVGAGIYFHSENSYYGLSIPNFFQSIRYVDNSLSVNRERMNLYFIAGHVFYLNDDLAFKPAVLVKAVQGAPLQTDLSANFMYKEKFVLGAAWRWSAAISLMAGFQASENLYIGYGYDLETTRLRNYNAGSHEIFLRYDFFISEDRIASPRFF